MATASIPLDNAPVLAIPAPPVKVTVRPPVIVRVDPPIAPVTAQVIP